MKTAIRDLIRERTEQELIRKALANAIASTPRRCKECDNELEPDGFCLGSQCREVKKS